METGLKWNLEEATEISVLSGWDVIRFEKPRQREGVWRYWNEKVNGDGVSRSRVNIRHVKADELSALLEKYEAAGCGVLVAAPRKEPINVKLVKAFSWDLVTRMVYVDRDGDLWEFGRREGDMFKARIKRLRQSGFTDWGGPVWDVGELKYFAKSCVDGGRLLEIYNAEGEMMNYEQK